MFHRELLTKIKRKGKANSKALREELNPDQRRLNDTFIKIAQEKDILRQLGESRSIIQRLRQENSFLRYVLQRWQMQEQQ